MLGRAFYAPYYKIRKRRERLREELLKKLNPTLPLSIKNCPIFEYIQHVSS